MEPFWVMGPARRLVNTDGEAVSKRGASGKPLQTQIVCPGPPACEVPGRPEAGDLYKAGCIRLVSRTVPASLLEEGGTSFSASSHQVEDAPTPLGPHSTTKMPERVAVVEQKSPHVKVVPGKLKTPSLRARQGTGPHREEHTLAANAGPG